MIENVKIKIIEDVATLKTEVSNIKKQVEDMDDMKTAITKLVTLQEESEKDKKIFHDELKTHTTILSNFELTLVKINDNFDKINDNLNGMNTEIKNTNSKMDDLKKEVYCKMNDFEDKFNTSQEEKNYFKIDKRKVGEFVKNNYKKILVILSALGLSGTGIYKLIESLMS